jgi:hypothetical protein
LEDARIGGHFHEKLPENDRPVSSLLPRLSATDATIAALAMMPALPAN